MDFQKNCSDGSQVSAKVLTSPKCSYLLASRYKLSLFVAHMWRVGCVDFQENPSNGSRDTHIT